MNTIEEKAYEYKTKQSFALWGKNLNRENIEKVIYDAFIDGSKAEKWMKISDKDSLPNQDGRVLVFVLGKVEMAHFNKANLIFDVGICLWDWNHEYVTHWQPIIPPTE